jgi:hypothetical protein
MIRASFEETIAALLRERVPSITTVLVIPHEADDHPLPPAMGRQFYTKTCGTWDSRSHPIEDFADELAEDCRDDCLECYAAVLMTDAPSPPGERGWILWRGWNPTDVEEDTS